MDYDGGISGRDLNFLYLFLFFLFRCTPPPSFPPPLFFSEAALKHAIDKEGRKLSDRVLLPLFSPRETFPFLFFYLQEPGRLGIDSTSRRLLFPSPPLSQKFFFPPFPFLFPLPALARPVKRVGIQIEEEKVPYWRKSPSSPLLSLFLSFSFLGGSPSFSPPPSSEGCVIADRRRRDVDEGEVSFRFIYLFSLLPRKFSFPLPLPLFRCRAVPETEQDGVFAGVPSPFPFLPPPPPPILPQPSVTGEGRRMKIRPPFLPLPSPPLFFFSPFTLYNSVGTRNDMTVHESGRLHRPYPLLSPPSSLSPPLPGLRRKRD